MKAKKITVGGKEYYLVFNAAAKFALDELCGDQSIVEITQPNTKEAHEFLFKAVAILAEQGELVRRRLGYDKVEMLKEDDLPLLLTPIEIMGLKTALYQAVAIGYGREIKDDRQEVDLVLLELQKKTELN